MGCFAGASHITRIIRRAHTSTLGDADVLAAGVVALFTGPLWTIAAAAASALCGVYCMAAGKHRAPFIPFLNVAAVITVALADGNLIASHGGLLYD
jgi:prepilin signal peptidase PulO-like enzyme (type II secretory pathway)